MEGGPSIFRHRRLFDEAYVRWLSLIVKSLVSCHQFYCLLVQLLLILMFLIVATTVSIIYYLLQHDLRVS